MWTLEKSTNIIRSLSGLVNYQGLVIGVSDEYHALFVRGDDGDHLFDFSGHPLDMEYLERKKVKLDHESISLQQRNGQDFVFTLPSFSKPNRNQIGVFHIQNFQGRLEIKSTRTFSCDVLLHNLSSSCQLNIEGHFQSQGQMYLLNRGNQSQGNELIKIQNADQWILQVLNSDSDKDLVYAISRFPVELGSFDGYALQWTDGIYETESTMIFLATVETTLNAYDDGQVLGSFIGRYNYQNNQVVTVKKILDGKKAEGICMWNSKFLVCLDADSSEMTSEFYSFPLTILDRV
ncbi:MAG: hypothetical protein JNL11_15345 [Bdellovibrionaceae bacterium]|nr:hypothetical protein [Pseudobdellovibrionaceae bacterium]